MSVMTEFRRKKGTHVAHVLTSVITTGTPKPKKGKDLGKEQK